MALTEVFTACRRYGTSRPPALEARASLAPGKEGDLTAVQSGELQARIRALLPYFYSPFDFGGMVTRPPRVHRRFRRRLRLLQIPADLTGKTVLDIGAYDGFFSFEFERRGAARVLAIDSFSWDHQKGLDCFLAARDYFNSKVEYRRLDVSEISPDAIGKFDLVFCAGVLYHLKHPLADLERIRSVTLDRLILETNALIPATHEWAPLMSLFAGDAGYPELRGQVNWHEGALATRAWLSYALKLAGFPRHEFVYTPSFRWLKKLVALVTNKPQRGRLIAHAFVDSDTHVRHPRA